MMQNSSERFIVTTEKQLWLQQDHNKRVVIAFSDIRRRLGLI